MILDSKSARRFYKLFYLLIDYANDHLQVSERLFDAYGEPSDEEAHKVAQALWKDRESRGVITDFVRDNPRHLSRHDLEDVAQWEHALSGGFLAVRSGRDALFMCGNYAFAVRGITKEVDAVAGGLPAFVTTTLLPFDGAIVYAMSMEATPLDMGDTMRTSMFRDLEKHKTQGRLVRGARDFARRSATIEEELLAAEAEDFARDVELDMNADEEVEGQHRGALAGLVGHEREAAVQRMRDESVASLSHEDIIDAIRRRTTKRTIPNSLSDVYRTMTRRDLQDMARLLDAGRGISSLRKEELVQLLAKRHLTAEGTLAYLRGSGPRIIDAARKLVEAGGRVEMAYEDVHDLDAVLPSQFPIYENHDTGTSFVAVMVPEYVEVLKGVDWEEQMELSQRLVDARKYLQLVVDLRGVEYLDELLTSYEKFVGKDRAIDREDLLGMVLLDSMAGMASFVPHESEGAPLLVSVDLAPDGEVDNDAVEHVLELQSDKPVCPVTKDMMEAVTVYCWALDLPEARALMAYLDEHVPDDADDYYFAEDLAGAVIESARMPTTHPQFLKTMEQMGYVPTEAQFKRFLELANALANAAPCWANRGWSANEMSRIIDGGMWTPPRQR